MLFLRDIRTVAQAGGFTWYSFIIGSPISRIRLDVEISRILRAFSSNYSGLPIILNSIMLEVMK